jgi:hypothetical protein
MELKKKWRDTRLESGGKVQLKKEFRPTEAFLGTKSLERN